MKLSIITINYNNLEGLKRTYDSVVSQTCQDFEWIIIDGGSTDGSKEFIEEHQYHFAYWCSEPDRGVYHAMNKGIAQAKGEYLNFMNSGDNYADERVIYEFISAGWDEEVIAGDIMVDNDELKIWRNPEEGNLDFDYMMQSSVYHQPSFIKKNLFKLYGGYDENLRIVADWTFFINALILHNGSYRHWRRIVANYMFDGISSKPENHKFHMEERNRVLNQYARIIRSIEKRNKRIQELDLPIMVIFRRKLYEKIKKYIYDVKNLL